MEIKLNQQENKSGDEDVAAQGFGRISRRDHPTFDPANESQAAYDFFAEQGFLVLNDCLNSSEVAHLNEMNGPVFKVSHDPRVTIVGRFLRKTSLDEFPQLINVLRGEMALVGPRPPLPSEVVTYEAWQKRRLSMKPGITCLWQVNGRNKIDFDQWMRLDLEYIDNWSLALDLKIVGKTVPAVLLGRGAS